MDKLYHRLILLFLFFIVFPPLSFAESLKLDFKTEAFFHNLEYLGKPARLEEGKTFFGDHIWEQWILG